MVSYKFKFKNKKIFAELCSGLDERLRACELTEAIVTPETSSLRLSADTQVTAENISRTAMIVVGECLNRRYEKSRLYAPDFSHMYRGGFNGQL